MSLKIGSLCSGVGGLDMAVMDVLGGEVAWHAEVDPAACRVLEHHWPGVPNHGDLTAVDWQTVEWVDVITAGYPCQPFSSAGKQRGEDDERYLWPEVRRAIAGVGPRFTLLENVRGHLVRGFARVLGDLAHLGYDATWTVVRADEAGAPHRRARLFVLAVDAYGGRRNLWGPAPNPDIAGLEGTGSPIEDGWAEPADGPVPNAARHGRREGRPEPAGQLWGSDAPERGDDAASDAGNDRCEGRTELDDHTAVGELGSCGHIDGRDVAVEWGPYEPAVRRWERILGRTAPVPSVLNRNGKPRLAPELPEWMQGYPAGWITAVPGVTRKDALHLAGNSVCPQQGALALRTLLDMAGLWEVAA